MPTEMIDATSSNDLYGEVLIGGTPARIIGNACAWDVRHLDRRFPTSMGAVKWRRRNYVALGRIELKWIPRANL